MLPLEYLHCQPSLFPNQGPLAKLVEDIRRNPPREAKALVLHSVFQDKKELSRGEKLKRKLQNQLRPLTKNRRMIQPSIQKDPDKLYLYFSGENSHLRMDQTDYALSFAFEDEVNAANYRRLPLYAIDGDLAGLTADTRPQLLADLPEKSQFCEFVYSHDVQARNRLCELVARYRKVTCPGKCLNNAPSIDSQRGLSPAESRQQDDWFDARLPYCRQFKFSIASENERSPGYTTEKILTAFRAGTIPIYYGDPRIAEEFNPASFLDAGALSEADLLARIEELDTNPAAYQEMLSYAPVTNPRTEAYFTQIPFIER